MPQTGVGVAVLKVVPFFRIWHTTIHPHGRFTLHLQKTNDFDFQRGGVAGAIVRRARSSTHLLSENVFSVVYSISNFQNEISNFKLWMRHHEKIRFASRHAQWRFSRFTCHYSERLRFALMVDH